MRPAVSAMLLVACLVVPVHLSAEEIQEEAITDFEELDLEQLLDVVVSAAKHQQDIAEAPSATSVITRDQIENSYCTDVICLLRLIPEVDVRRTTPIFPTVGARTMNDVTTDKALVIVDGREINNDFYGFPFWGSLPIHLEDIERIEIVRGPGSSLYGANAHSMVVSIITRKTTGHLAEVFLGAGEHNRNSLHLRLGQQLDDWHLQLSGGLDTADNWRLQDVLERDVARVRLEINREVGNAKSTLQLGLVTLDGKFYSNLALLMVKDGMEGYLLLRHQNDWLKAQLSVDLTLAEFSLDMPLFFQGAKMGEAPDAVLVFNSSVDGEVQITQPLWEGNLLIGGCNVRRVTAETEANDPDEIIQWRIGAFIHDEQRLFEDLVLTLGARFDWNSITPRTFSPRVAGVWQFADHNYLRLGFGMAFRKPSFFNTSLHLETFEGEPAFRELKDFFRRSLGNENLDNESVTAFEAGYTGRFFDKRLTVEAIAFYNRYRDTIRNEMNMVFFPNGMPNLTESSMQFENTGRDVDSLGGTISVSFRVSQVFRVNLNYTLRNSWFVSVPEDETDRQEGRLGDRVPWEPAHLIKGWFHYLAGNGLRLGMGLFGQSSTNLAVNEHGGPFDPYVLVHNPGYLVVNGFIAWRSDLEPGWMEIGVRAYNVLSTAFRDLQVVIRTDGEEMGGEMLGRRIFLFLRGAV